MIIAKKEMKLNRFRQVSIPRNKDLFVRIGKRALPPMADGQVAYLANGVMQELDAVEAQFLRSSQMPLNEPLPAAKE